MQPQRQQQQPGKVYAELHYDKGYSWNKIAQQFNSRKEAVRSAARRYRKSAAADFPQHPSPPDKHSTDIARELLQQFLGSTLTINDTPMASYKGHRRIIVIADLHGSPAKDILAAIVREQPDLIVVAGDLIDGRESTPHPTLPGEYHSKKTIRMELQDVRAYLEQILLSTKSELLIMRGNHDCWPARRAAEALAAFPDVLEFWQDPLDLLLKDLPQSRVSMVNTLWQYHYPDKSTADLGHSEYMCVLGDALISHANFTGSKVGDAVFNLNKWLGKWRRTLGLPDLTLLVQAHVHNVCFIEHDAGNQIWIEPGACFEPIVESYKVAYQPKWKPGSIGALYFEQVQHADQWVTDLSSVRLIRPRRNLAV